MTPAEIAHRRGVRHRSLRLNDARPPVAAAFRRRAEALLLTLGLIVITLGVGWLAWSLFEWRRGRTAGYRLTGLRVVRRSDGAPIGFCRSFLRSAIACTLLLTPTLLACALLAVVFVMGASPPDGLLSSRRRAPWDVITGTEVVDERRDAARRRPTRLQLGTVPEGATPSMN